MMGNFEAVIFFAIVAYLSTFFTKNMVIVFLVSILATNFLMVSKVNYFSRMNSREGMQNKDAADAKDVVADAKDAVTKPSASPSPSPSPSSSPSPSVPKPTKSDSKKTSAEKKKEGMNGKLAPAKFNDESDDDGDASTFPGNNADRNGQMEKAHDTLQNISSGAGVGAGAGGMKLQTEEVMKQLPALAGDGKTDAIVGRLDQPRQAALPAPVASASTASRAASRAAPALRGCCWPSPSSLSLPPSCCCCCCWL
jgi:hypothetical protein